MENKYLITLVLGLVLLVTVTAPGCAAPTVSTPSQPEPSVPAASPTPEPTPGPTPVPLPTLAYQRAPKSAEEIQRIGPEELKSLIEGEADIIVVDNNPASAYESGHVPGAVNLPWDLEITSAGDLPKDKLLILYCACAHEEDASDVAMQMIERFGYEKIMLLEGGWLRWVELGYEVEKGG